MFLIQPQGGCYGLTQLNVPNAAVDCLTPDAREIFVHSQDAQASGLSRRHLQANERRAREADSSLCPAGLTACRVFGTDDGYEVGLLFRLVVFLADASCVPLVP